MIRNARTEAKMSQQAVADALGVRQQTVAKWESGENRPTVENILSLVKALPGLDAMRVVLTQWPELRESDRLAGIQRRLENASDEQIASVEAWIDRRPWSTKSGTGEPPGETA